MMFLFCYHLVSGPLYPHPTQWLSQSRGVHVSLISSQWLISRGCWKFGAETSGSQFLGFEYRLSRLLSLIQCFSTGGHLGCHTGTPDREKPGMLQDTPQSAGKPAAKTRSAPNISVLRADSASEPTCSRSPVLCRVKDRCPIN